MEKAKLKTVDRPTSVSRDTVRTVIARISKTGTYADKSAAGSALPQKVTKKK